MENKKGIGKKIGGFVLKAMAFLLTGVLALVVTLLLTLSMLCSDAYPSVQRTFVTTILETGQLKFLASWFLSLEEIQSIVAIGAGTVSKNVYGDGRIERCDTVKDVDLYIEKIDEMIDRKRKLYEV